MGKLAIFGGQPLVEDYSSLRIDWPIVDKKDKKAVISAFDDNDFCGRGSKRVFELEKLFEKKYDGYHATALNSGTAALHLALLSTGIKPGDEVIVPSLTFIASAMSVIHNQSIPVFADIDKETFNILPEDIEKKITSKTKAVIVVHMHGLPADMRPIMKICKKYKLKLIEDVAQAPGAMYHNRKVGTFGDASIFSLMSQKNIPTCGEGGILLNRELSGKNRAEMARIYGEIIKPNKERVYNSFTLGWNYTLNPLQAAMAITQFRKSDKVTDRIQVSARSFNRKLSQFGWILPPIEPQGIESVFHFYRFRLNANFFHYKKNGNFRRAIQDALDAEGLNVRHYQKTPLSGQPFFQQEKLNQKLPWMLNQDVYKYDISDSPNTLNVLNNTLVLGAISSSPGYLLHPETVNKYVEGFKKIEQNIEQLLEYANKLTNTEPWKDVAVISDSFSAKYEVDTNL